MFASSEGEGNSNVTNNEERPGPHYNLINITQIGLRRSKRRKSEKSKCYSTIRNVGFMTLGVFTTIKEEMVNFTLTAEREIYNCHRTNLNIDWTDNVWQPMALITSMINKDTLTYGEMIKQPDKGKFVGAMIKEVNDHEERKH